MKHSKLISLVVMLTIFGSVAGVCWVLATIQQSIDQPPNQMPKLMIQENIRDATMTYIATNHQETAVFTGALNWTGGRQGTNLLGSETYTYQSDGWTVTIHYPVIANPISDISVNYAAQSTSDEMSIPYALAWQGIWENSSITETSYSFAQ
jgi:hypothetical protein